MPRFFTTFRTNSVVYFAMQAANLAVIPVLTRAVDPASLAAWFLWFNVVALLTSLGTLRYELAIVTAKTDEEALGILVGACAIALTLSLVAGGCIGAWQMAAGDPVGGALGVCAAGAGACGAIVQGVANWNLRVGRVAFHTVLGMLPTLLTALCQIALAWWLEEGSAWLVFGGLCGYVIPAMIGLGHLWFTEGTRLRRLTRDGIHRGLADHRRFPTYSLPFTAAVLLRERAIFAALGFIGDATAISLFGLSQRLVNLANTVVSAPLRPVFFQFAARTGMEQAKVHIDPMLRVMSWLIVPGWTAVLVWAPELLGLALGEEWSAAAPYLRVLSVPFFIVAVSGWLDRVYDVLGEQRRLFVMEAVFSAAMVVALLITLAWSRDPMTLTKTMGAVSLIYGWGWLAMTYIRLGLPQAALVRLLAWHVAGGGMVVGACNGAMHLAGVGGSIIAVGAVIVAFALYSLNMAQRHLRQLSSK